MKFCSHFLHQVLHPSNVRCIAPQMKTIFIVIYDRLGKRRERAHPVTEPGLQRTSTMDLQE